MRVRPCLEVLGGQGDGGDGDRPADGEDRPVRRPRPGRRGGPGRCRPRAASRRGGGQPQESVTPRGLTGSTSSAPRHLLLSASGANLERLTGDRPGDPVLACRTVLLIGLTGGIGSGKSTVSAALAERGAVVIDADAIVRELQAPGGPCWRPWSSASVPASSTTDGTLDRQAVADIVFTDDERWRPSTPSSTRRWAPRSTAASRSSAPPTTWWCSTCPCWWRAAYTTGGMIVVDIDPEVAVRAPGAPTGASPRTTPGPAWPVRPPREQRSGRRRLRRRQRRHARRPRASDRGRAGPGSRAWTAAPDRR